MAEEEDKKKKFTTKKMPSKKKASTKKKVVKKTKKKVSKKTAKKVTTQKVSAAALAGKLGLAEGEVSFLLNRGIPSDELTRIARDPFGNETEFDELKRIARSGTNEQKAAGVQNYLDRMKAEGRGPTPPTGGGSLPKGAQRLTTRPMGSLPYGSAPRPGTTREEVGGRRRTGVGGGRVPRGQEIVLASQAREARKADPVRSYKPRARRAGEYVRSIGTGKGVAPMALRGLGVAGAVLTPLFGLLGATEMMRGPAARKLAAAQGSAADLPERLARMSQQSNKGLAADMDEAVRISMSRQKDVPLSRELQDLIDIDTRQIAELRRASKPSLVEAYARRGML